jgi:DUF1365 family protein
MPLVRRKTNGVEYSMYQRGEHWRPHLHLDYAEFSAVVALDDLSVLHSNLGPRQLREALNWVGLHREELLQVRESRMQPGGIYTIAD